MNFQLLNTFSSHNRFAVILAGGDGLRLGSFVRKLRGDSLPKQYVNFFSKQGGNETNSLLMGFIKRKFPLPRAVRYVALDHRKLGRKTVRSILAVFLQQIYISLGTVG